MSKQSSTMHSSSSIGYFLSSNGNFQNSNGQSPTSNGHSPISNGYSPTSNGPSLTSQGASPTSRRHSPQSSGNLPTSLAHFIKLMGNSQLSMEISQENIGLSLEHSPPPFNKPRTISDPKDFFEKLYGPDNRKQTQSSKQVIIDTIILKFLKKLKLNYLQIVNQHK